MTDPIAKLETFTLPAPNRDELLFAAGRASARVGRWWKALTGLLAVTQTVTLGVLFWPTGEAPPPRPPAVGPSVVTPVQPAETEPPVPVSPPDPSSYLAMRYRDGFPESPERVAAGPTRQSPPLTAGSWRFE